MFKVILAASAAVLAMSPALAGPGGHGGGNGGGNGGGHGGGGGELHAMGGGGHGNGGGHGHGGGGGEMRAMMGGGPGGVHGSAHGGGHGGEARRVEHGSPGHGAMSAEHANRGNGRIERRANDFRRTNDVRYAEAVRYSDQRGNAYADRQFASEGNGCPPGLAAKNNGCLPPGQAKKLIGSILPGAYARSMLSGPYADWYRDDNQYLYRVAGDNIYRVDRGTNLIDALIPYGGSDFNYYPVGMNYPADYNYYNVPVQYRSYYPDGGDTYYRYGDNAIYGVNPQTSSIQSIVALLAGDLGVGQRLPSDYGVYNVPLSYRDRYYDTADNLYRYNDGYIYRVDPKTQLITSVINAVL